MGVASAEEWGRGVDITAFHPDRRNDAMRSAFANNADFVFVHVGRLAAEKNVHRIVEAFRTASTLLPPGAAHLVIAGTGPEEAALRAAAPSNVSFLGVLDRQRLLPMLYASADAFLFSSLTETLGLVVLEAMASGLPVIAVPAGGVADHLRNLENGLTVAPNDHMGMARAIVEIVTNRELLTRLGKGARRTAEGLSWGQELDRLDRSYRQLLSPQVADSRVVEPLLTSHPLSGL
jgi:phosphatidylinositol alpha 1,6-mannosyltransferase